MTQVVLLPLMIYAAAGLVLSLTVHLFSFTNFQFGGNALFMGLHVGIFPLGFLVAWIASNLLGGRSKLSSWKETKALLSGAPQWMQYMTYGFSIYAFVNFAILFVTMFVVPMEKSGGGAPPVPAWRVFSGGWMMFYSAGLTIVTVAYRRGLSNLASKCRNGHAVASDDKYCPECGARVDENWPKTVT